MDIDPTALQGAPEWAVLLMLVVQQMLRQLAQRQGTSPEAKLDALSAELRAHGERTSMRREKLDERLDRIEIGCPVARGEGCPALRKERES